MDCTSTISTNKNIKFLFTMSIINILTLQYPMPTVKGIVKTLSLCHRHTASVGHASLRYMTTTIRHQKPCSRSKTCGFQDVAGIYDNLGLVYC